jgi:transposase
MHVLYERCAGIDVHKKTVVVCIIHTGPDGAITKQIETFATMTADLLALADWLQQQGVTHLAMESSGVYWKPVHTLLEEDFTVGLVNPQHIKAVPGRKTDVRDSEWLAELLRHGLLAPAVSRPSPSARSAL